MVGKNSGGTPWYVLNAPEIGGAFQKVEQLIQENGVLEAKTNSLLRLALTAVCRDAVGTEASLQQAIAQGATREEITEVFLMAGRIRPGSANLGQRDRSAVPAGQRIEHVLCECYSFNRRSVMRGR